MMKRILAYGPALKTELQAYIRSKKQENDTGVPWRKDFLDRLLPYATGGKLLRGSVLCFSYEMFARQLANQTVMQAAMALELAHSALLIHDDIMDGDKRRRGQRSIHYQYQLMTGKEIMPRSERLGENMALAAGDATLFLAFELLGKVQAAHPGNQSIQLFSDQLLRTCFGQMQDVYLESRSAMPSKKDMYNLMQMKTGAYTIALPLAMGGALAGQPAPVIAKLQTIGTAAGTIFQIRDDELGVMGDSQKTGKPVDADVKEGKKTLLRYYLFKKCSAAERKRLEGIFGNEDAGQEDIKFVQALVKKRGLVKQLGNEIKLLESRANAQTNMLDINAADKIELYQLVSFCGNRAY